MKQFDMIGRRAKWSVASGLALAALTGSAAAQFVTGEVPAECLGRFAGVYQRGVRVGFGLAERGWTGSFGQDCQRFESFVEGIPQFGVPAGSGVAACYGWGRVDGMFMFVDGLEGTCAEDCAVAGEVSGNELGAEFCALPPIQDASSLNLCELNAVISCEVSLDQFVRSHCPKKFADPAFAAEFEAIKARCEDVGPVTTVPPTPL